MLPIHDWADRWLGGFCALGAIGGLPVRGPDYAAHPPLAKLLTLPPLMDPHPADEATARAAWSDALGGAPVLLLGNTERARSLLLRALAVTPGAPVGLPANANRDLTEAVKHHGAQPQFLALRPDLALQSTAPIAGMRVVWSQPCGGAWATERLPGTTLLLDASDTVPALTPDAPASEADVILYGLHLNADIRYAGALLVCREPALLARLEALRTPDDRPDAALALAQLQRLTGPEGLAACQHARLDAVRHGLNQAAGLPLLAQAPDALAQYIAVRVPDECDAATFYAYVLGEHTPVRWLPALHPLHYAALRADNGGAIAATAAHLARVLLVPVGPDYTNEEISHAVLGVAKAADYLGLRWYTDPARAAWYAELMNEWYGADHDAYRPLFAPSAAAAY